MARARRHGDGGHSTSPWFTWLPHGVAWYPCRNRIRRVSRCTHVRRVTTMSSSANSDSALHRLMQSFSVSSASSRPGSS